MKHLHTSVLRFLPKSYLNFARLEEEIGLSPNTYIVELTEIPTAFVLLCEAETSGNEPREFLVTALDKKTKRYLDNPFLITNNYDQAYAKFIKMADNFK